MTSDPNPFSKLLGSLRTDNPFIREFMAEVLGTFILITFGDASVAQVTTSAGLGSPAGDFFAINWGWGVGVALAVIVAGGVSGAHLNPAVTLAMVVVGKLPSNSTISHLGSLFLICCQANSHGTRCSTTS